jgi:hypothetical protein
MKNISAALKLHLAQETTTLARCWKITRLDGKIFGFTSADKDLTVDSIVYLASTGVSPTSITSSNNLSVDNLEVNGFLDSSTITELDLLAGLWDYANVVVFDVNFNDLTMGKLIMFTGTLGTVNAGAMNFTAELRGLTQPLQQNLLEYYSPGCRASLGDTRCTVNLVPFTAAGTVGTTINQKSWYDTSITNTTSTTQYSITAITQANPAVVTAPGHNFTTGQTVNFIGIAGMTELNGKTATVTFISSTQFSININTSVAQGDYSAYISGGTVILAPTSEYYQNGVVTWTSGANLGLSMEVKTYRPGYIELFQPMIFTVALGDTYSIKAGCDKQLSTCLGRFNNVINFRGEPHIPGNDQILQHGFHG